MTLLLQTTWVSAFLWSDGRVDNPFNQFLMLRVAGIVDILHVLLGYFLLVFSSRSSVVLLRNKPQDGANIQHSKSWSRQRTDFKWKSTRVQKLSGGSNMRTSQHVFEGSLVTNSNNEILYSKLVPLFLTVMLIYKKIISILVSVVAVII